MAKPQLQIEQRVERLEKAVDTMARWLVEAQTGFGEKDYKGIRDILDGTEATSETSPDAAA